MSSNEVVLLDSLLDSWKNTAPEGLSQNEVFELFCLDQILKDYELDTEELLKGRVGGGNDGGIDGLVTFFNGEVLEDDSELGKGDVQFDLFIVQAKQGDSFQESVFEKVTATVQQLFDLSKDRSQLEKIFCDALINQAMLFREALVDTAARHPQVRAVFILATKGSTDDIDHKVRTRAEQLQKLLATQIPNCEAECMFLGARELLEAARRRPGYTLKLEFSESPIAMPGSYVVLVNLGKYFEFITDEAGALRKYIFDWNVRDFQGDVEVNRDIQATLSEKDGPEFWWLNNGITILTSKASITGKTMALDDVQIVNGLQTSVSVFEHVTQKGILDERRSLLCRVIETKDDNTRDRVIKATNFQTAVPAASLKASDQVQRDIEQYFATHHWYYDRRKNYHKNHGRPANCIVSIPYLAQAVMAVGLSRPNDSRARPTSLIKKQEEYDSLFSQSVELSVYL